MSVIVNSCKGKAMIRKMGSKRHEEGGTRTGSTVFFLPNYTKNHNPSLCFLKHYATKMYEGAEL